MFKIGAMIESFKLGLHGGLKAACELGVDGVQIYATQGETHYKNLQNGGYRELQKLLSDMGLEISAVCSDFGGPGFENRDLNATRIEATKRIMEISRKLGTTVVTTHIGVIPKAPEDEKYQAIFDACKELGGFAEEIGVTLAIETGPEPSERLRTFIENLQLENGISVNFDPANLKMVCRENVIQAVKTLAPFIAHTHAKDGKNLKPVNPQTLYACFADEPVPADFDPGDYIMETPLGDGDVPFPEYLQSLKDTGNEDVYLTIEREVGDQPKEDIRQAVNYLKTLINSYPT